MLFKGWESITLKDVDQLLKCYIKISLPKLEGGYWCINNIPNIISTRVTTSMEDIMGGKCYVHVELTGEDRVTSGSYGTNLGQFRVDMQPGRHAGPFTMYMSLHPDGVLLRSKVEGEWFLHNGEPATTTIYFKVAKCRYKNLCVAFEDRRNLKANGAIIVDIEILDGSDTSLRYEIDME